MGSADPRAFARGKRGIAGSLVFIQFDTNPLLYELANPNDKANALYYQGDTDDLRPEYSFGDKYASVSQTGITSASGIGPGTAAQDQESDIETVADDQQAMIPWYEDQIPPFDIVLSAANEYGALAIMKILGVEILSGGYGVSIDDIVSEHSYTFIATGILPWTWQPAQSPFKNPIRRGGAVLT